MRTCLAIALLLLFLPIDRAGALKTGLPSQPQTAASGASKNIPSYAVLDIDGRQHTSAELTGRGGLIYFFCGCDPCHRVARLWSQIQRGGALPKDASGKAVGTVVMFFGEADGARAFMQETGLDPAQTTVIADPMMTVGHQFGVEACPRAFVADAAARIRYTNTGKDDGPEAASEAVIVSRTVQALRDNMKPAPGIKPATAANATTEAGATGLVALAAKGDEVVSPVKVIRHLGEFSREKSPPIEEILVLANRGNQPLQIAKVEGSCGCTDMSLYPGDRRPKSGSRTNRFPELEARQSMTLPSGGFATLRVVLSVSEVEGGRHRKYAWVLLPGSDAAAVTMCLDFVVHSSVTAGARRVEFGLVKAGEGRTVPFTITVDENRYVAARPPSIVSTNPNVTVHPASGVLTTFNEGKPVVQISYDVAVSPSAALGNITGALILRNDNPSESHSSHSSQRTSGKGTAKDKKAAANILAALGGEVVGEIRALPGTVLFGTVQKGKPANQRVTLLMEKAEIRAGLHITTSAPWLTARLTQPEQTTNDKSILGPYATLEIGLTPQTPAGLAQGAITLATASGQKLVVPVLATVKGK